MELSLTVVDIIRVMLAICWLIVAVKLAHVGGRNQAAKALRIFGASLAALYFLFYVSFIVADTAGWTLTWHNEVSRFLSYMTVSVFMSWAFLSDKHPYMGRVRSDA